MCVCVFVCVQEAVMCEDTVARDLVFQQAVQDVTSRAVPPGELETQLRMLKAEGKKDKVREAEITIITN